MWRILGLAFFGDKDRFVDAKARKFRLDDIIKFCSAKGIALYDTATAIRRLKDNASDKFLEVVEPTDVPALLGHIPECKAIAVTGEKAAATLCATFGAAQPRTGEYSGFTFKGHALRLYRLPSSSRAYPLPLQQKATVYKNMFQELGMTDSSVSY